MRVTSASIYGTVLSNLHSNLDSIDLLNYQISSGSKLRYSSDDPVATHQTMWYKSDITRTEQYLANITEAKDWLMATDNALDQVGSIYQRVRSLVVQGANDSNVALDRQAIAREVDQLLDELVNTANVQHGSRYLFGGNETLNSTFNESPFGKVTDAAGNITDVVYRSDRNAVYREVDENVRLQVNVIGDELFQVSNHRVTAGLAVADETATLDAAVGASQGYFRVNGKNIYYDTTVDSLNAVVARINGAGAGVQASVDTTVPGASRLVLTSSDPRQLWLQDVDRNGATAVREGLLNDLQVVNGNAALDADGNYTDNVAATATEVKMTSFRLLIQIRDDLNSDNAARLSGEDLGLLDDALEGLLLWRAETGGRQNRLEQKESRLTDYKIQTTQLLQEASETDMADAIMQLKQFETMQQAALSAGARIFSLSLMSFLK